jgi:hypothetical protein
MNSSSRNYKTRRGAADSITRARPWCLQASPVRAACLRLAISSTKQASKPKGRGQASKHMDSQTAWLCLIHFWQRTVERYHVYTRCLRRAPITERSELALSEGSQTTARSRLLEIHAETLISPLRTLSFYSCRSVYIGCELGHYEFAAA